MENDFKFNLRQSIKYSLYIAIAFMVFILIYYITVTIIFYGDQGISSYKFSEKGALGDYLNGFLTPIVGLGAVITTFLAFVVQFQANQKITDQFEVERFENKFYEMIRLHKENVKEIDVAGVVHGRKAFVRFFYEFKFLFYAIKGVYNEEKERQEIGDLNDDDFLIIAYNYYFYGNGKNSTKFLDIEMKDYSDVFYFHINKRLSTLQKDYLDREKNIEKPIALEALDGYSTEPEWCEFFYYPFDGHVTKLAHYYRHLYQTVKYVVNTKDEIISTEEKRLYLKTLRAQLSNHEQIMLYYNSFTGSGKDWRKNKYFTDWKMIKNIPFPALIEEATGIYERLEVTEKEVKSKRMFEWGY